MIPSGSGCSTNYARKDLELDELFGEIDIPLENVGFSRGLGEENAESFDFKTAGLLNFLLTDDRSLILPPMSYNLDSDAIIFPYGKISSEIPSVDDKIDMIKSNEVVCSPQEHRRSSPPLLSELSGSTESTSQWTDFFDDLSVESDRGTTKKSMNMMNVGESTFRKLNSGLQKHRVSKNPLESARGKKSSGNIDMGVLETLRQQIELQSQLQRQIQDQWKLQSELEKNSMRLRKMLEQQKEATRCLRPVQSSATLAKHGERNEKIQFFKSWKILESLVILKGGLKGEKGVVGLQKRNMDEMAMTWSAHWALKSLLKEEVEDHKGKLSTHGEKEEKGQEKILENTQMDILVSHPMHTYSFSPSFTLIVDVL